MKAISHLFVHDRTTRDKDGNILKEKHFKKRWWFGIRVFEKEYDADTTIVETRKTTGYK